VAGIATPAPDTLAASRSRWLTFFAIYLLVIFALTLIFALLPGLSFANRFLTIQFLPLGVPWQVMVYGLMGGCISCLITLGRSRSDNPPLFVMITWFTRPYIGIVLAILAYLFLTSGLFFFGEVTGRHNAAFLLVGALAGLGEGLIFIKRK
jgi:hypothetical protein